MNHLLWNITSNIKRLNPILSIITIFNIGKRNIKGIMYERYYWTKEILHVYHKISSRCQYATAFVTQLLSNRCNYFGARKHPGNVAISMYQRKQMASINLLTKFRSISLFQNFIFFFFLFFLFFDSIQYIKDKKCKWNILSLI